jgi:hypothetical protein
MTKVLHRNRIIPNILVAILPWVAVITLYICLYYEKWDDLKCLFIGFWVVVFTWLFNLAYWAIYVSPPHNKHRFIWFLAMNHMAIAFLVYLFFIAR